MKTLLYVLVPASTDAIALQDAFDSLLNPHRLDQSLDEIQADRKFDYLCLLDPTLNCTETEAELPREVRDMYHGTISKVSRLRADECADALVTPDGIWHDIFDFGWRILGNQAANDDASRKWHAHFSQLLRANIDCWVIETWAHS
jgi:hypothetical protein